MERDKVRVKLLGYELGGHFNSLGKRALWRKSREHHVKERLQRYLEQYIIIN